MGGLITRYALADWEQDENEEEAHDVRLFIAHDSPMQGAYIPLGVQHLSRHLHDEYTEAPILYGLMEYVIPSLLDFTDLMFGPLIELAGGEVPNLPSVNDVLTINDTPAAMQMLYQYVDMSASATEAVHQIWQEEFDNVGYPQLCRSIAISNGNECGQDQGFEPGDKYVDIRSLKSPVIASDLLQMIITPAIGVILGDFELVLLGLLQGSGKYDIDFDVHENPEIGATSRRVYHGKITYIKKLLWVVPITHTLMERNRDAPAGFAPLGTYPGGRYDILNNGIENALNIAGLSNDVIIQPFFGFIPVVSALDIRRNNLEPIASDYFLRYAGSTLPEPELSTPFDNFIVDFDFAGNRPHISFQVRNGNWLADELNEVGDEAVSCAFACEAGITGPDVVCSVGQFSVPNGFNGVLWTVTPAAAGTITAGQFTNNLTVQFDPQYRGTVTISANVTSAECNGTVLTKQLWVGKPLDPTGITGARNVLPGSIVGYLANIPGATSYNWTAPVPYTTVSSYNFSGPNWQIRSTTQNSPIISAFTGTAGNNGTVTVQGCNICGCGGTFTANIISSNTGIGMTPNPQNPSSNIFSAWPNPASNIININLLDENSSPKDPDVTGQLYDFYGLQRGSVNIVNNQASIDVNNLPNGLYILQISYDSVIEGHLFSVDH